MKNKHLPLFLFAMLATSQVTASDKEGSLITLMGNFQYFMHKTALSLDAKNLELVKFYAHEIEENLEVAEDYGNYKNLPIGNMVRETMVPEFEKFEGYIDEKDLSGADQQFNKLIEACNSCHRSSKMGFLKIERISDNPYLQSFTTE